MTGIAALRRHADRGLLLAARASQALVISSVGHVVSSVQVGRAVPWPAVRALPARAGSLVVGDPVQFVDDTYDVAQQLVELHREFAQRLIDVLAPVSGRDARPLVRPSGDVLPFPVRRAASGGGRSR